MVNVSSHTPDQNPDKNIVDVRRKKSASAKAVSDFRNRLSSPETRKPVYELELLYGFARNQVNAGYAMPLFVLLVAIVNLSWYGWVLTGLWFLITALSYLLLSTQSRRFLKKERTKDDLPVWRRNFLMAQLLIGTNWAVYAFFDCIGCGGTQYSIIQFSTLLVFQAVTAMLTYAFGRSVMIMAAPASLILAIRFLLTYDPAMVIMGLIIVASLLFFYLIADRFKRSVVTMLRHTFEKEALIVELETEKSFSEEARSRAEEANLAKSRFLATMSHELRTPLNAILGFSEIIRDEVMGPIGNDMYKEYISDIHNSGSHLLHLINEILDISRIEAGKHELNEESVSLVNIADDACHMVNIKAKQKDIKLTTSFEDGLPNVWADERALRQIVLNLLSNAMKFTPANGEVTVKVGWTQKGGQYLSVKDSGPGIPEEEIPIVLSSFGQGSIAIKHAEQGTGLGLAIVQALLHIHQGRFELRSKLRQGTEAIAFIPESRVIKSTTSEPKAQEQVDLAS